MQDVTIDQKVFLAMTKGGSSGVTSKVAGFMDRYGTQYVIVQTDSGKQWKAPASHVQDA